MASDHLENWYLRKHDSAEIFGPVRFEQIHSWALTAQINSQDMVSIDKEVWTKAPMIPDLTMDWLIEVSENLLYGPTTAEALMEFCRLGEITRDTPIINCKTAESMSLGKAAFFTEGLPVPGLDPAKGGIRVNLQKRIRELECSLLEKRRQLAIAQETIAKLEAKVRDLDHKLADIRAGRK
ncbi:MAG: hypothetical protein D4R65_01700 [Verrucomicrobiaceae bacterium]|nr:MAG: hypothetical protein D4R65_01700 [Verrucomicrobiaceae bacterium]